jgi:hypothetical protein
LVFISAGGRGAVKARDELLIEVVRPNVKASNRVAVDTGRRSIGPRIFVKRTVTKKSGDRKGVLGALKCVNEPIMDSFPAPCSRIVESEKMMAEQMTGSMSISIPKLRALLSAAQGFDLWKL